MRYYELMLVVSPQLDDEGMAAALDRVNRYVTDRGGSVVRQEPWGRLRRLAYPIRNFNEANYVLTHLEMDPQDTKDLEASLHLTEDVLRHLLLRIDAIPPAPAPRVEPAAAQATEATTEAAQAEATAGDAQPAAEATETTAEAAPAETAADDAQPAATAEAAQAETAAADTQPAPTAEAAPEVTAAETAPEAAAEPAADESPTSDAAAEETDQPAAGQAQ